MSPFAMSNLTQIKQNLKWFSQDPDRYIDEYQTFCITYGLTWADLHVLFPTFCNFEIKKKKTAQVKVGETHAQNIYRVDMPERNSHCQ